MGENRRFGWLIALFLAAWTGLHFYRKHALAIAPLTVAAILAVIATVFPNGLELPRRAWMKLGEILGHINQPIILGFIFYIIITPVGFFRRKFGHAKLDWKTRESDWKQGKSTYWHHPDVSGAGSDQSYSWKSLRRQF